MVGIPLIALSLLVGSLLWRFYLTEQQRDLRAQAFIIADEAAPRLSDPSADNQRTLARMTRGWRLHSDVRVTIIDASGIVRASTINEDVGTQVNNKRQPGLRRSLSGNINSTVWKNPRFGNADTIYVNVPVRENQRVVGAVRVGYTLTQIQNNIRRIRLALVAVVTAYALMIALFTLRLASSIVGPVEELNDSALVIAAGDLEHRIEVRGATEITQLANTLNRMTQYIQQLEGMRRQFVSHVSHELRTPLAAIRSMAEIIELHGDKDPSLPQRYAPRIIAHTVRLARMTSQLLELAQIESGKLPLDTVPVSISSLVEESVRTVGEAARTRGVTITTQLSEALPELHGDRDRLMQIFINLLDNAIRHTPARGTITVAARVERESAEIIVADTGEGIAREHVANIFDRFYRVDHAHSGRSGGSGLGLSIVQQIVQAHGGQVSVESAVGQGTRFRLTFPLGADSQSMKI
jgi:signal transduction histidine kinase